MTRALVAALLLVLITVQSAAGQAELQPTAIELAASVAVCMHQGRGYPTDDGLEGIYVEGTLASAHLREGDETFAVIYAPAGEMVLEPFDGSALRGPAWARERTRYAINCFSRATAMAPRPLSDSSR